jgi:hypothetical protein
MRTYNYSSNTAEKTARERCGTFRDANTRVFGTIAGSSHSTLFLKLGIHRGRRNPLAHGTREFRKRVAEPVHGLF